MKKISVLMTLLFLTLANVTGCSPDDTMKIDKEDVVNDGDLSDIEYASIYFKYDKGAQEAVDVYVHVYDSLYTMFRVSHEVNLNHYKNLWRVKEGHMYALEEGKMTELYPILTTGENEFVWGSAREGVEEATGGYHGNERIDVDPDYGSIAFFADDKAIDLSQAIPLTATESFHYIQHSTMHQTGTGGLISSSEYVPVPGNPIECYHEKKTVFENGGYVTHNKLEWADNNTPVKRNYFALFCVTPNVSKEGYSEDGSHVIFNDNGGMKLTSGDSEIVMLNRDLDLKITCDSHLVKPEGYPTTTMIWDRPIYHKYYNGIGGGGITITTEKGDTWEAVASIRFEKLE